jgi:pyruvate kinase
MIARGGLGVELGLEKVHKAQRYLIKKCKEAGVPSITATEMLQSMMESPKPTRAEVSDVTTAVLLGCDAVMLSGESAAGKFPVEAVEYLSKIVLEAEN